MVRAKSTLSNLLVWTRVGKSIKGFLFFENLKLKARIREFEYETGGDFPRGPLYEAPGKKVLLGAR